MRTITLYLYIISDFNTAAAAAAVVCRQNVSHETNEPNRSSRARETCAHVSQIDKKTCTKSNAQAVVYIYTIYYIETVNVSSAVLFDYIRLPIGVYLWLEGIVGDRLDVVAAIQTNAQLVRMQHGPVDVVVARRRVDRIAHDWMSHVSHVHA